jgi:hypothetical protein
VGGRLGVTGSEPPTKATRSAKPSGDPEMTEIEDILKKHGLG